MNEPSRANRAARRSWWEDAVSRRVVKRALKTALIVGTLLILLNHGDLLLSGELRVSHWIKMILTPVVPYVVSTTSSVATLREARV